jgi:hypothetical protein
MEKSEVKICSKKLSSEEFKVFVNSIKATYRIFCFNKIGHEIIGKEPFRKPWEDFMDIWNYILVNSRFYYLVNVVKIFDPEFDTKTNKSNISFCRVVPGYKDKLTKQNLETIRNVRSMRNEILVHPSAEALLENKYCEENYGLDPMGIKIESLFKKIFELLNEKKGDYQYSEDINQEKEKENIQKRFKEWYKIFEEKYV